MRLTKLAALIKKPVCRVCFKTIRPNTLFTFFNPDLPICPECLSKLNYHISRGILEGKEIFSLAPYQEPLSRLLIQYKEGLDYELYPVFLYNFKLLIRLYYSGYVLLPVPSSPSKLNQRGFNHLIKMLSILKMPILDLLHKDESLEQKKKNALERRESKSLFHISGGEALCEKKVLLFDDVITSGTSLKACLSLIEPFKPKRIKVLVLMNDVPLKNYLKS